MGIPEGGYQVIAVEHPFGRSTRNNFAKYARGVPALPAQQSNHQVMDGRVAVDKIAQVTWFLHPG